MKPKLQTTFTPKPGDIDRKWWVVDASGVPLGRLASKVAFLLRGKHKPTFAPHFDGGDFVIVINSAEIGVTGKKEQSKRYYRHSGFPGGLSELSLAELRSSNPERIIESAVKGMLPKNRIGRKMIGRLKPYPGIEHPHTSQRPEALVFSDVRQVVS